MLDPLLYLFTVATVAAIRNNDRIEVLISGIYVEIKTLKTVFTILKNHMIWYRDVQISSTCTWFVHTLTYMYYKPSKTLNNLLHKLIKLFIIANMRNVWDKRLWIDCLLPRNIRVIGLNKPQTYENSQSWISLRGNDITIINVLIAI